MIAIALSHLHLPNPIRSIPATMGAALGSRSWPYGSLSTGNSQCAWALISSQRELLERKRQSAQDRLELGPELEGCEMTRSSWAATLILLGVLVGCSVVAVCQPPENLRPVAAFHVFSSSEGIPASVLLDGTSSADPDGSIISYQWLFGDGTTGSGPKAEHTYPRVSQFEVTLVVIDNRGGSHMITKTVDLSELERQDETTAASSGTERFSPTSVVPSSAPEGSEVGDRAPDFTLPTLDGDIVQLSTYVGRVVLVEFWFRTCSGCISSLPHLEELRSQFEDEGLVILIVVLDHNPAQAEEFFAESEYTAFILAHEHDWSRPTRTAYDVGGTPHVFLIDRNGAIRFSGKPGYLTSEFVASWL